MLQTNYFLNDPKLIVDFEVASNSNRITYRNQFLLNKLEFLSWQVFQNEKSFFAMNNFHFLTCYESWEIVR